MCAMGKHWGPVIDDLVERQARSWFEADRAKRAKRTGKPVITVSREHGSGGGIVAKKLAETLGYQFFHSALVDRIAESLNVDRSIIESVDEKVQKRVDTWLTSLFDSKYIFPSNYLQALSRVLGTIADCGEAVVVGRGGYRILPRQRSFNVRIVAPLEFRVENTALWRKIPREQALERVLAIDAHRRAFVKQHFNVEYVDPVYFDLVVNTEAIGVEGALGAILEAYRHYIEKMEGNKT